MTATAHKPQGLANQWTRWVFAGDLMACWETLTTLLVIQYNSMSLTINLQFNKWCTWKKKLPIMVEYYILCQIKTSRYVPIKLVNIVLYIYICIWNKWWKIIWSFDRIGKIIITWEVTAIKIRQLTKQKEEKKIMVLHTSANSKVKH